MLFETMKIIRTNEVRKIPYKSEYATHLNWRSIPRSIDPDKPKNYYKAKDQNDFR